MKLKIEIKYKGSSGNAVDLMKRIYKDKNNVVLISSLGSGLGGGACADIRTFTATTDLEVSAFPDITIYGIYLYEGVQVVAELDGKPIKDIKIINLPIKNDQTSFLIKNVMDSEEKISESILSNETKLINERIKQDPDCELSIEQLNISRDINWSMSLGLFSVFMQMIKKINLLPKDKQMEILKSSLLLEDRYFQHLVNAGVKFDVSYLNNLRNKANLPNKYYEFLGMPTLNDDERTDLRKKWHKMSFEQRSIFESIPEAKVESGPVVEKRMQP